MYAQIKSGPPSHSRRNRLGVTGLSVSSVLSSRTAPVSSSIQAVLTLGRWSLTISSAFSRSSVSDLTIQNAMTCDLYAGSFGPRLVNGNLDWNQSGQGAADRGEYCEATTDVN